MKYYLYIKTSPLNLKYLGKTTKDPYVYMGSGKIWKRHIKKHNFTKLDIKTEVILETVDENELINMGIELSILYNIVESKDWANLIEESGNGGDTSKFIDYSASVYHNSNRSKHLNDWLKDVDADERKRILSERISNINFDERAKKSKENTNWDSWRESIKHRKIDYSKFLNSVHDKNKKPVLQFDLDGNFITEFDSASTAARSLECNNGGNITNCCRGRCKSTLGYKWEYKDKDKDK